MKKIIICLVFMLLISGAVVAQASEIVGHTVYTDVVTYINHYPIPSYSFNGLTLVAAEDLQNYGFDVHWNEYKWCLTIERADTNTINPFLTFRPTADKIGKKEMNITTTDVSVYTGYNRYTAFGGLPGKTLINIWDLRCIDGVSVTWVPEVNAVKVWVEDGLEMAETPALVRPLGEINYYNSCYGINTVLWAGVISARDYCVLNVATVKSGTSTCVYSYGNLEITDVINADGYSIKKTTFLEKSGYPSIKPYALGWTDYYLSSYIVIKKDDLYLNTASEPGGLIKFKYSCCDSYYEGTMRVDFLPQ